MILTINDVRKVLAGWNIMYPGSRTDKELQYLSQKYFKALAPLYSKETFYAAVEVVEGEQTYFPVIAHLKGAREQAQNMVQAKIVMNPKQKLLAENSTFSKEDIARNLKGLQIISKQALGKITEDEAMEELKGLGIPVLEV